MSANKFRQRQLKAMSRGLTSVRDRYFSDEYNNNLEDYLNEEQLKIVELQNNLKNANEEQSKQLKNAYFEQSLKNDVNFIMNNIQELVNSTSKALYNSEPSFVSNYKNQTFIVGSTPRDITKTFIYSKEKNNYVSNAYVQSLADELKKENLNFITHDLFKELQSANEQDMSK